MVDTAPSHGGHLGRVELAMRIGSWVVVGVLAGLAGCNCGPQEEDDPCDADGDCGARGVCLDPGSEASRCMPRLVVRGQVTDEATTEPISGALVALFTETRASGLGPVSTDADGRYELVVDAARDSEGRPQQARWVLDVSAQGYQRFPSPVRVQIPIDVATAVLQDGEYVVDNELTHIPLTPVSAGVALGRIAGRVEGGPGNAGVLITAAEGREPSGLTALSHPDGSFTIFNVPAGSYTVRAYARGVNAAPVENVTVATGAMVEDVVLSASDAGTGTVRGSITPVAGGCAAGTSVVLVPRESLPSGVALPLTAVTAVRAEVPRGLRAPQDHAAPDISGNYSITGVPPGVYEVLAAYENDVDPCVYDPSNIGGALLIREVTVAEGGDVDVEAFKVTGAVALVGPGEGDAIEPVDSLTPVLSWQEYASAKNYQVAVYDAVGRRIWVTTVCPDDANGCALSSPPSVTYGTNGAGTTEPTTAPPLQPGMLYQWRVIALGSRNGASCGFDGVELTADRECISISENLRGVFRTPAE